LLHRGPFYVPRKVNHPIGNNRGGGMHPCLFNFRFNLKEVLKLKHIGGIIVV
jgi:hypothetical protein